MKAFDLTKAGRPEDDTGDNFREDAWLEDALEKKEVKDSWEDKDDHQLDAETAEEGA